MKATAKSILTLGIPIIFGQLGSIAQQFADTMMVGQYGTLELAGAGFVNNVFNLVIYFILGISYATTPVIGSAFGSGDKHGVVRSLLESIIVNLVFSLGVVVILVLLYCNIEVLDQPADVIKVALPYFLVLTVSVPFMAVFNAMKQFSDAIGETKIPMWIMLGANVLNIILNYALIFGHWLCPELGLLGAGIATLASRVLSLVFLTIAICRLKRYNTFFRLLTLEDKRIRPTALGMRRLSAVGLPISIQLGLEASSFNVAAVFMGWLGAVELAAHQVMCTISTLCFQILYGIGAAASVLISQSCGKNEWGSVRRTAGTAFALGLATTFSMITIIYLFRYPLVRCFTESQDVMRVIFLILPCFFIYQFGDCMQITFANALRGIEKVKRMMLYAFIAYVMVSIPLSYLFAFVLKWGSVGVWAGIPFGLTTAGLLFLYDFRRNTWEHT